jgi:hypothetical protein
MGKAPQLPDARVGLVPGPPGGLGQGLVPVQGGPVGPPAALGGERQGVQHVPPDVVLGLLRGLVADAHRAHSLVAGQLPGDPLAEPALAAQAVEGLQRRLDLQHRGGQPAPPAIDQSVVAQPGHHPHHKQRVPQPAVAVVPAAPAARALGHGGGQGGDDAPAPGVGAELERHRRAGAGLAPAGRGGQGQPGEPALPGGHRAPQALPVRGPTLRGAARGPVARGQPDREAPADRHGTAGHQRGGVRVVCVECEAPPLTHKLRPVGRRREDRGRSPPAVAGAEAHLDRSAAPDRRHRPHQAALAGGLQGEVVTDDRPVAASAQQPGLQRRGLAPIGRARVGLPLQGEGPAAAAQQRREHRGVVQPRQAAPDHPPPAIHQRRPPAVADQVQALEVHGVGGGQDRARAQAAGSPRSAASAPQRAAVTVRSMGWALATLCLPISSTSMPSMRPSSTRITPP